MTRPPLIYCPRCKQRHSADPVAELEWIESLPAWSKFVWWDRPKDTTFTLRHHSERGPYLAANGYNDFRPQFWSDLDLADSEPTTSR